MEGARRAEATADACIREEVDKMEKFSQYTERIYEMKGERGAKLERKKKENAPSTNMIPTRFPLNHIDAPLPSAFRVTSTASSSPTGNITRLPIPIMTKMA